MNIADGLFYKENFHVLSSLNIIELDRKILIYYIQNYLRFNEINSFIDLDINKTAEKYYNKTGLKFANKLYLVDNKLNDSICYLNIELQKIDLNSNNNFNNKFTTNFIYQNINNNNNQYEILNILICLEPKEAQNTNIYNDPNFLNKLNIINTNTKINNSENFKIKNLEINTNNKEKNENLSMTIDNNNNNNTKPCNQNENKINLIKKCKKKNFTKSAI